MDQTAKPLVSQPAMLEQLGALGSLLIHDMANQMCIISGNATFAQMMTHEPQQLARAIEAITKSAERISYILGQCAELRRRLGGELPEGDGGLALEAVKAAVAARPGWALEVANGLDGRLQLPSPWVGFAVDQVLREASAKEGRVRVRRANADSDTSFLPGGVYFEVRAWWESPRSFCVEDLRNRFENYGLLAAFELLRQCGGKLEGYTPIAGRQEVLICAPYIMETGRG